MSNNTSLKFIFNGRKGNNMRLRLLSVLAVICLSISIISPVSVEAVSNDFISDLQQIVEEYTAKYPEYTDEIINKVAAYQSHQSYEEYYYANSEGALENIRDSLDYYINYRKNKDNDISPYDVSGSGSSVRYYVTCPSVMQENSYYCGPAAVYMAIEGIRNHVPSAIKSGVKNTQDENAKAMGTTSDDGTAEYKICERLNNMLQNKKYLWYIIDGFTSQEEFVDYIKYSLADNSPVILMIHDPFLSYYPSSYPYIANHYIVVTDCFYRNGTYSLTVNDPNNWGSLCGPHGVTASDLYNSTSYVIWGKFD